LLGNLQRLLDEAIEEKRQQRLAQLEFDNLVKKRLILPAVYVQTKVEQQEIRVRQTDGTQRDVQQISTGAIALGNYVPRLGQNFADSLPHIPQRKKAAPIPPSRPTCPFISPRTELKFERLELNFEARIEGDFGLYGIGTTTPSRAGASGSGIIVVDTIPENAVVCNAFLYWNTIGAADASIINFAGQSILGANIGVSGNTCWIPGGNNKVYLADVTSLFLGNGSYLVSGLPARGNAGLGDSQGACLLVLYRFRSKSKARKIAVYDGAITITSQGTNSYAVSHPNLAQKIGIGVGDGQPFEDGPHFFNGQPLGKNLFAGTNGAMLDALTFDLSSFADFAEPAEPASTSNVTLSTSDDCLCWFLCVLST
jgi:hypothetical protein